MNIFEVRFPPVAVEADTAQQAANIAVQRLLEGKVQIPVRSKARVIFARKADKGPAKPQTWWPMGKMAQILCPFGHNITLLADNHVIRDNGEVTPSVVCKVNGCTFHDFIQLDGWTP